MRLLVTAGPTREMIDAVRYLGNLSSGRTGLAVAAAARELGHEVVLVAGPLALSPPPGIPSISVVSALEMRDAVLAEFPGADAVIMAAAVADFRPAKRVEGKLKKAVGPLTLELERNPDILRELGRIKDGKVLVGFALEVQNAEEEARAKFAGKNLDLLVLNGPENLGAECATFRLLCAAGFEPRRTLAKPELGRLLVERTAELVAARRRQN